MVIKDKNVIDELIRKNEIITLKRLAEFRQGLDVLSSGIFPLDLAFGEIDPKLGNLGVTARSVLEVEGENNCFKTGIGEHFITTTLNRYPGRSVACVWSEPPNDRRLESLGADLDRVLSLGCYHPDLDKKKLLAENALNTLIECARDPSIKLCVIDSVAALTATNQLYDGNKEKELGDTDPVASMAKVMNLFIKEWNQHNEHAVLLFINQERDEIRTQGMSFAPTPLTRRKTSGGRGMEFRCDYRVNVIGSAVWSEKLHPIYNKKIQTGIRVNATVFKNKNGLTTGSRPAEFSFDFTSKKLNNEEKLIQFASFFGIKKGDEIISELAIPVAQAGAWNYIGDKRFGSAAKAAAWLKENPDVYNKLVAEVGARQSTWYSGERLTAEVLLDDE